MKIGPEGATKVLEEIINALSTEEKTLLSFLNSHKDRIDAFHKSGVVVSIVTDKFPVAFIVAANGCKMAGITLSDPFERSPSPYRMKIDDKKFYKDTIKKLLGWNLKDVKAGVFSLPPHTRFIAVCGCEELLKKIILQEQVKGQEFLSFAESVDDKLYKKFIKFKNTFCGDFSYCTIDDDGLHVAVLKSKSIPENHAPLLSEMARAVRDHFGLKPSKFSKIPCTEGKIVAVYSIELSDFINSDAKKLIENFEKSLVEGYRGFVKGAGVG